MNTLISELLRKFGRLTPDILFVRALGNRILWPAHKMLNLGGGIVDVLGIKMELDPNECVDRNLWFTPHLYDKDEIQFALNQLKDGGIFIDAGANIGFWTLVIADSCPRALIYAVEANPFTKSVLDRNIALNNFVNIIASNCGLAGQRGELILHCGNHGNRGGDSFVHNSPNAIGVRVPVMSLSDYCQKQGIEKISFLKMDIEGMESQVLASFFDSANPAIWPKFICVEILHSLDVNMILESYSYVCIHQKRENAIFKLRDDQNVN